MIWICFRKKKSIQEIFSGFILRRKAPIRDDEDCLYADCSSLGPQPFTRLHPYLWRFMKGRVGRTPERPRILNEPAENKFYWEVTKYIVVGNAFTGSMQ